VNGQVDAAGLDLADRHAELGLPPQGQRPLRLIIQAQDVLGTFDQKIS
jgi:hypothetical protein